MTSGVILAGGAARRMGGADKALRSLAGRTLLDHVTERLRPQVDRLALNANGDPARFATCGLPVIADAASGRPGPLAGVLAAVDWAARIGSAAGDVVTVPCDTPFIPGDLVERLRMARDAAGADIAVAASGGQPHWVVALWPVACSEGLALAISQGVRAVERFVGAFRFATAEFPAALCDPFFNVNSPADLDDAERMMAQAGICQTAFQQSVV